jgi:hypothetical protein
LIPTKQDWANVEEQKSSEKKETSKECLDILEYRTSEISPLTRFMASALGLLEKYSICW